MKILDAIWFTPWTNDLNIIGLVKCNSGNEIKYYIGIGKGESVEEDIKDITNWGTRIYPESISRFLGGY